MDGVAASFGFALIVALVAVGLYSAMNNGVGSTVTAKPDTPPHSKSQPFKTPRESTPPSSVRPAPPPESHPPIDDKKLAEHEQQEGRSAYNRGDYVTAWNEYTGALHHDPDNLDSLNEMAWLSATCPNARLRDADCAVRLSEHLLELVRKSGQPEWYHLGTAAAAHAEHGDFDVAVRLQKQSIERTPDEHIAKAKRRLRLYENHKPFHGGPND